jgi:hypothetical protein
MNSANPRKKSGIAGGVPIEPKDMFVFLDIDETFISSQAMEDGFSLSKHKTKASKFTFHDMDDYYITFERPCVQEFLTWLFATYNVCVWTAASKDYAMFVIDKVIFSGHPERKLQWVFWSYHCDLSKDIFGSSRAKDLRLFYEKMKLPGMREDNVIIIDDNDNVHKAQIEKCIHITPFDFLDNKSEKDRVLLEIKKELLKKKNPREITTTLEQNEKLRKMK